MVIILFFKDEKKKLHQGHNKTKAFSRRISFWISNMIVLTLRPQSITSKQAKKKNLFKTQAKTALESKKKTISGVIVNIKLTSFLQHSNIHWPQWLVPTWSVSSIDLIHDTCDLCKRFCIDGIKALSQGISGGKQMLKFANTSNQLEFVYSLKTRRRF